MSFGMVTGIQNLEKKQNHVTWIETVYIKTEDIYADIAKDIETRFDNSNFVLDKPLPKVKNRKVIRLMKAELGRNIMKEFVALRAKTYSYLTDSNNGDKIAKGTKKCVIKETFKFEDYEHCLEATQLENKINELEKTTVNGDSLKENYKEFIKK